MTHTKWINLVLASLLSLSTELWFSNKSNRSNYLLKDRYRDTDNKDKRNTVSHKSRVQNSLGCIGFRNIQHFKTFRQTFINCDTFVARHLCQYVVIRRWPQWPVLLTPVARSHDLCGLSGVARGPPGTCSRLFTSASKISVQYQCAIHCCFQNISWPNDSF